LTIVLNKRVRLCSDRPDKTSGSAPRCSLDLVRLRNLLRKVGKAKRPDLVSRGVSVACC
jgi:hypothetical protein